VSFSEQPASEHWAALKFKGQRVADVWFKPEGDPLAVMFRIPQKSFRLPGIGPRLTLENLLKAVDVAPAEVESWQYGETSHAGMSGASPELTDALPQPPQDTSHLEVYVRLQGPEAVAHQESWQVDPATAKWQDLEARWKAILGLEASMDTVRISMESLRIELESSLRKALTADEKLNALSSDLVQLSKAKNRIHYALPKANEFIHRAVWALGTPERKKLDEFFKEHTGPDLPIAQMDEVLEQLENLQKDRQVLSGHGTSVYQECKSIAADVQGALRILQSNAVANANRKRGKTRSGDKAF